MLLFHRPTFVFGVMLAVVATVESFIVLSPTSSTGTGTTGTTGTTSGTLTIGTTALGTALAGLGVLGALKLGMIAIAAKLAALAGYALAKKLHYQEPSAGEYHSYSEYPEYGHQYMPMYTSGYGGGYGGSYGGGYGGGYGGSHYHKKRSVEGEPDSKDRSGFVLGEEEALDIVHESDESRCGERLVCELARREKQGLASDEESILNLIKRRPTGPSGDGSRLLYLNAMTAGYRRRSCRALYPSCPFTSNQIIALVRSMGRDLLVETETFINSTPDQQTLHPEQNLLGDSEMNHLPTRKRLSSTIESYNEIFTNAKEFRHENGNGWRPIIRKDKFSLLGKTKKIYSASANRPGMLKNVLTAPALKPEQLSNGLSAPKQLPMPGSSRLSNGLSPPKQLPMPGISSLSKGLSPPKQQPMPGGRKYFETDQHKNESTYQQIDHIGYRKYI